MLVPGEHLRIDFTDTGHGISPDVIGKIFDPFFTTKGKEEGTGLGLSSAWSIVRSHNGAIEVESRLGVGTTFTLYFPTVEAVGRHSMMPEEVHESGTERILLVDDESALVRMGSRMLEPLGYSVTAMGSSLGALRVFETNPLAYDLVITDQIMPEMTGVDLARRLLEIRPDLPIILISGYTENLDGHRIREAGIRAFLTKPLSRTQLTQAIRRLIDKDEETFPANTRSRTSDHQWNEAK
jgi:CheY-like chemotaxis protein